ncbi:MULTISPECIES: DUF3718 domain-containing protein [unclassified Colwellia]|uniref:DUF3718 domain-containing protein n=1 Tax=unclassified Colwellia TaxID=196834 RepID=UPI0015F67ED3|nr:MULTISPECIES: DUF3718 domain-containing protein [unclassified Colwellia]MBA6257944.1 DUF3718 domain-containing protein [Colwellia sp. MB3u-28]MBA6258376.1 DUF3718 domain-containing protein [Colwellia sp. MB3u-41]
MNYKNIAVATIITLGFSISAQAAKVTAIDNSIATNLCVTAATGNRAAMYKSIKSSGYSSKYVANNIECNGKNLLSFVEHNGKNSAAMLKLLDRTKTSVSITDLASVN